MVHLQERGPFYNQINLEHADVLQRREKISVRLAPAAASQVDLRDALGSVTLWTCQPQQGSTGSRGQLGQMICVCQHSICEVSCEPNVL